MLHIYRVYVILIAYVSWTFASTTVSTEYGDVWSDKILTTKDGKQYLAFQGIPYAAPPVGSLRFQVSKFSILNTWYMFRGPRISAMKDGYLTKSVNFTESFNLFKIMFFLFQCVLFDVVHEK